MSTILSLLIISFHYVTITLLVFLLSFCFSFIQNYLYIYLYFRTIFIYIGSGSGLTINLVFLNLGSLANVFSNTDDGTRLVNLPSSFHIGNRNFLTLYVRFSHIFVIMITS